ncbi:MAG TPA: septal ring lytic transglycosylase RlpA family protein [Usitatibacter sp.]|nr:septal ring lytic transglycosylase RlpA family protein [Usitatibacter sp.]
MKTLLALLLTAIVAAGCGTTAKRSPYYSDDGPPQSLPENLDRVPEAVPRPEPPHRYANRPYTVFGETYTPVVNTQPFKQRGVASWYGKKFQGQKTASGEPYDMFKMTAAHKTLPIPSYVKVTNVANGKSVVVRINDRGPFHSNRIIDLSYAAASRIGLAAKGSGLVEIERVFEPPKDALAAASPSPGEPPSVPVSAAAPQPAAPAPDASAESPAVDPPGLWIQLAAFSSTEAADAYREKVAREMPWIAEPVQVVKSDGYARVRLGPYRTREEAEAIAAKVRESLGYAPAIVQR